MIYTRVGSVEGPMQKFLVILLTTLLLHTTVHAADKIRISIANLSGQFMTVPLAQKRGFLKEEGIEAEIIRVTGGASAAALSSGDLDYGTGMALGGPLTGLPVKVVACFVPAPVFALVARPEVKSVQELKGKTVGISTFGGLSIFGARVIAKHFGLDPDKDIKFVAVGAVEGRFIRLTQGLIDAAVLAPPLDSEAKKKRIQHSCQGGGHPHLPRDWFSCRGEENPREARRDQARHQGGHQGQPLHSRQS